MTGAGPGPVSGPGPGPKDTVRRGYDRISHLYRADDEGPGPYGPWIEALLGRLAPASQVLDLGCGCGIPVSAALARAGHAVTGVDLSGTQIARARQLVPSGTFRQADAATVTFPGASFDAVVCLYVLIHLPLEEQPPLLAAMARWLKPGGTLLATTGQDAWTGEDGDWLGGGTPMWWSHADAATYRRWIEQAGLTVTAQDFIPEGTSGHALFWASR